MGKLWRRAKRHKVPATLAVAVLMLAAGGAGLAWRLAGTERYAEYVRLLILGQQALPSSVASVVGSETEEQPASRTTSWGIFSEAIDLDPNPDPVAETHGHGHPHRRRPFADAQPRCGSAC